MKINKNPRERRSQSLRFRPLAGALALLGLVGAPAMANDILVNDLSDPGLAGDALCSLREAVANAASDSDTSGGGCAAGGGADTIKFSVGGTISLGSTLVVGDSAGQIVDGTGKNVVLSGNGAVRVLRVNAGSAATVRSLTITNGFVAGSAFGSANGAGVANAGTLTVVDSTFSGNRAGGRGGAIANLSDGLSATGGTLAVMNSTFTGNQAFYGGAIDNAFAGVATFTHSTIARNSAITPPCTGICVQIIADGGGIANAGGLTLNNTLVAGNLRDSVPSEFSGIPATAGSFNLVGDTASAGGLQNGVNGNIVGVDAATVLVPALGNYGGPTATLALLPGSLALDTAGGANCPPTDQRGIARPQGSGCDIGAFEQVVVPTADLAVSLTAAPNPVLVQDRLTLTASVFNRGPNAPTGVKLALTLPVSGLKSITTTASPGTCGAPVNGVISCLLGSLASGGSATISVSAIPTAAQTLTSSATVSSELADNQTANNSASQTVAVQPLLCNGLKPTLVGTPGPDVLTGTKGRDIIQGLSGNDTISGKDANDVICGGEGQDVLSGGNGSDQLFGDNGGDSLNGDAGNDVLNGGAGTDSCNGSTGTDTAVNCEAAVGIP